MQETGQLLRETDYIYTVDLAEFEHSQYWPAIFEKRVHLILNLCRKQKPTTQPRESIKSAANHLGIAPNQITLYRLYYQLFRWLISAPGYLMLQQLPIRLLKQYAPLFALWIGGCFLITEASEKNPHEDEFTRGRTEARIFWATTPPQAVEPPEVHNNQWPQNAIDRFVMAKLEEVGLQPSRRAAKTDLIRRATLDLTGLPPTPEEVDRFVTDDTPNAYAQLIDRLLASPHYGEKWGQVWLDVIRYSESEGFEYDRHLPYAWRFRDYVIRSFNADKPFDQFIMEQVAGDELDSPGIDARIAAGFHRFGPVRRNMGNPKIALSRNEVLTERTDIIGSAFLGITMGCARCHDHKLDPISQADYYSLQAFLGATAEYNHPIEPKHIVDAWTTQTAAITEEMEALKSKREMKYISSEEKAAINDQLAKLKESFPEPLPSILSIKNDDESRTEVRILHRGVWETKGEKVDMRFPEILALNSQLSLKQGHPKPRTALAEWLIAPNNPLTTRVLVNRVWLNHFGNGIVNTPNDFGTHGELPSHPELLDYLAHELLRNGWHLKPLHKLIMMSEAYQQSARTPTSEIAQKTDPSNRLLWKFSRRRLQAEEIRDALLSISGQLNKQMFGESIMLPVEKEMVELLYDPKQWTITEDKSQHNRRSVYLVAKRNLRLPFMETFDQPTLQISCAKRESSTHAPQALELMNGATSNQLALRFAERLKQEVGDDPRKQIERAWQLTTGRSPESEEAELALEFLQDQPLQEFTLALFNLNAFLYVR